VTLSFRDQPRPEDEEAVRRLVTATGFFHDFEIDVAAELVRERLEKGLPSGYLFLLAEQDGRLLGYTCYGEIACTKGSYDLYWIAVDPAAQGQGLGRTLMARTEDAIRAQNGRAVYAETSGKPQYQPTRAFYERFGFTAAASLPDFYDLGDDKIIYVRTL
jgi:GNAT superfamily N-acetyltransferase